MPGGEALRPTPDRVRETLFNWLAPVVEGARCLDLFAGSGVLGFEAVSRGARLATLVEADAGAVAALEALKARLGADDVEIRHADAATWLQGTPQPYDVVFVDPPYASGLLGPTLAALTRGWLTATALVYVEGPAGNALAAHGWVEHRAGATRHTRYALLRRAAAAG